MIVERSRIRSINVRFAPETSLLFFRNALSSSNFDSLASLMIFFPKYRLLTQMSSSRSETRIAFVSRSVPGYSKRAFADGRYHVALYNPVSTKTTMRGLVRLPKALAIFPTIRSPLRFVRSDET